MTGLIKYGPLYYTCSFTEFLPFCVKLYYFSNFKDFNRIARD